jgi:hypothetical protein
MSWKQTEQLEKEYSDIDFREKFMELYSLSHFFNKGLYSPDYKPPKKLKKIIVLNEEGNKWISKIEDHLDVSIEEIHFALFKYFYHHDLLIDLKKTKTSPILELLNSDILGGNVKFPWVYERTLYDKFFDIFNENYYELSHENTLKLLENTYKGVFQIRNFLIGPFGVLSSTCNRFLPATREAKLWHCTEPSCQELHTSKLLDGKNNINEILKFVYSKSKDELGLRSQWASFFLRISGLNFYSERNTQSFPWLLINGFSEVELKKLLEKLINENSRMIWDHFPNNRRFRGIFQNSPENIIKNIDRAQCFQLLLLFTDEIIIETAEQLIEKNVIKIPSTEIRKSIFGYKPYSWVDMTWECSRLGFRPVSNENTSGIVLKRLIKSLYEDDLDELKWILRHQTGRNVFEKLERYINTETPKKVIEKFVFTSSYKLDKTFNILKYGKFDIPLSESGEKMLIDKLLWKLGFKVDIYPSYQLTFWKRLDKFLKVSKIRENYSEKDKELIRSEAVNFFVSLEEILDYSLSFITWALLSDHYRSTNFKCNFDDARKFMANQLNQAVSEDEVEYDPAGRNTLYPLIRGFRILSDICQNIFEENGKFKRKKSYLPRYHNKTDLFKFPFLHLILWLDLEEQDQKFILDLLNNISHVLEKSKIADIRNRIEHKRLKFPTPDEIINGINAISEIVNKMEDSGILPSIYFFSGSQTDIYGRDYFRFKNYAGKEIEINLNSEFALCNLPNHDPLIIVPCMNLGTSIEFFRFKFEETSEFVNMWRNYPKKRIYQEG